MMKYFNKTYSIIVLTILLSLAFVSGAKAESFQIDASDGRLNLGFAFKNRSVLPAPQTLGDTPLPNLWQAKDTVTLPGQPGVDPSDFKPVGCLSQVTFTVTWAGAPGTAVPNDGQDGRPGPILNGDYPCGPNPTGGTISGDVDYRGNVEIAENDFRFPIMVVPSPLDGTPVPITLAATDTLIGNYNNQTGGLTISGPIEARVLTGLATNPLGEYCAVPLPGVVLGSEASLPGTVGFSGNDFVNGLDGTGSLTGTWNISSASTPVGGADCSRVDSVIIGAGGLWLGAGIERPDPYPSCPEGTLGIWPNCTPEPAAKITGLKAKFAKKSVRQGKTVALRVTVKNSGGANQEVVVRLRGNVKKLTYQKTVTINALAGRSTTAVVKVTASKKRRAGARVWATLDSLKSSSGITVKKSR
jgi:hypothetical protein